MNCNVDLVQLLKPLKEFINLVAIKFPGHNVIFAEDQPEYHPLPTILMPGLDGEVITCWELNDDEIEKITKNRCIYISQLCFTRQTEEGNLINNPLQPVLPMAELGDNITLI